MTMPVARTAPATAATPPAPHDGPVPATLPRDAVAAIAWHAIVVGAGPAGAAVAIRLARSGRRVLLVDRGDMPRPKVCGACLSPRAVAELDALVPGGTGAWLASSQALPLSAVRLIAGGRAARIAMPGGIVRSREALDTALVREAVAAGAHWLPRATVTSIRAAISAAIPTDKTADETGAGVIVGLSSAGAGDGGGEAAVRGLVAVIAAGLADTIRIDADDGGTDRADADGRRMGDRRARGRGPRRRIEARSRIGVGGTLARDSFAPAAGLLAPAAGELVMAVGTEGYCGLVTLEDGGLDLAAAVDRRLVVRAGGPAGAVEAILAEAGGGAADGVVAALRAVALRATPPLTHVAPLAGGGGRIFRVGDAAGYVEPFTGEGIGWALAGARLLAAALLGPRPAADTYAAAHSALFASARRRVWRVARGVRHPRLVAGAVRLAGAAPWMAARAVPLVTGASSRARAGFPGERPA
jgi:2-polyprenyl-6-methoxyphenol hydroxylase-like FAD-dependent oxidoreductase